MERIRWFHDMFHAIVDEVERAVVGKRATIALCVTALVAGGHILLEDDPGTGKTQLARALARSVDASFGRIQFTPDLLPGDVVGVTLYDRATGGFTFRKGPVFASIVLADEINRASPKTQSALLEVMEERRITVDGTTHEAPLPFTVIATQNPAGQLGTYRLPEAQMDRFLIRTALGHPPHEHSVGILRDAHVTDRAALVRAAARGDDVLAMRAAADRVHVDDAILDYVVRLTEATRVHDDVATGASTRGALALVRCARVRAAADRRAYVIPDDVAELAGPVLAHRLVLDPEARFASVTAQDVVRRIVEETPTPTRRAADV